MSGTNQIPEIIRQFIETLRRYALLWLAPTIVVGALGTAYALFRSSTWSSWQAFHVRDEVTSELNGRFDNTDSRKAAQEIIFELARNRAVIGAALEDVGPPKRLFRLKKWPTNGEIKDVQDGLTVTAPKGSEFGKTDVIYLNVKADSPTGALELNKAVSKQLKKRLQQLRRSKAASMTAELREKEKVSKKQLELATEQLEKMERQIGPDLGELRTLDQTGTGESNIRTLLTQIKNDIRRARNSQTSQRELLMILNAAKTDSTKLASTPDRLLESQPALRKLKDGLVDATAPRCITFRGNEFRSSGCSCRDPVGERDS